MNREKAERIFEKVAYKLKKTSRILDIKLVGSWRRGLDELGDVDIVAAVEKEEFGMVIEEFCRLGNEDVGKKKKNAQIVLDGEKVDLWLCEWHQFGALVMFGTGSAQFNIRCRVLAKGKGMKLSQYGLTLSGGNGRYVVGETEEAVFKAIGMGYVNPEERSI